MTSTTIAAQCRVNLLLLCMFLVSLVGLVEMRTEMNAFNPYLFIT